MIRLAMAATAALLLPATLWAQDTTTETVETPEPPAVNEVQATEEMPAPTPEPAEALEKVAPEPAQPEEAAKPEPLPKAEPVTYKKSDQPPFVGEISGRRVNVRSGPSINHKILKVANLKDRLVVVGKKEIAPGNVWYEIGVPGDTLVWISAQFLKVEEGSDQGEVTGTNVLLRAVDNAKGDILGKTFKGEKLTVKRKLGNWYEVQAPSKMRAWVYGKFLKPTTLELPVDKLRLIEEIKFYVEAEMKKESFDIKGLITWLETKKTNLKVPSELGYVDQILGRLRKTEKRMQIEAELARLKKDLAEQMAMIEETARQEIENIKAPTQKTKMKILPSGYIRSYLSLWKSPAPYKLVKGGKVLYLLRSAKDEKGKDLYDLAKYFSRHVEIDGKRIEKKGYPVIIEVTDIRILK